MQLRVSLPIKAPQCISCQAVHGIAYQAPPLHAGSLRARAHFPVVFLCVCSVPAVVAKCVVDQAFMAPLGCALFYAVERTLAGKPHTVVDSLQTKFAPTMLVRIPGWFAGRPNLKAVLCLSSSVDCAGGTGAPQGSEPHTGMLQSQTEGLHHFSAATAPSALPEQMLCLCQSVVRWPQSGGC